MLEQQQYQRYPPRLLHTVPSRPVVLSRHTTAPPPCIHRLASSAASVVQLQPKPQPFPRPPLRLWLLSSFVSSHHHRAAPVILPLRCYRGCR